MSHLLPSNLSHARRKLHRRHSYPTSFRKWEDDLNGTLKGEKRRAVPVVMVDQDPLQEMEPDEYGAELGKEARVWKVYVKETDQWDAELVEGWNRSLDVILVFAALFSAVSTAFLIESSKKLEEDPSEVSAAALRTISQFLLSGANSSSVDLPPSDPNATSGFTPTRHAIVVNTLWYLSLSLSIATSLLAMLAKDWCHSFSANRTGHPWDQALRRQRKWVMIERWKMEELITVLPSLIHLSLLLFAVGLCMYVWDTNITAAIPIVCVSGTAFGFYVWSSMMASIMKLFPYTTIVSRALQSEIMRRQYASLTKHCKRCTVLVLPWIFFAFKWVLIILVLVLFPVLAAICLPILPLDMFRWLCPSQYLPQILPKANSLADSWWLKPMILWDKFTDPDGGGGRLYFKIRMSFARARHHIESVSPAPTASDQDRMTSLALKWLIQNCETPSSVTVALQAIAGASSRIPSEPLRVCQATLEILRRLVSSHPDSSGGSGSELYIRALKFLESSTPSEPHGQIEPVLDQSQGIQKEERTGDIEVAIWDLKSEHERQVVDLINSTKFRPTKENIKALTLGNSATSLSLRLLQGEYQAASRAFSSIMSLLFEHVRSGNQKLDPAALHSLAHATIVLNSCTETPLLSHDLMQRWMEHCVSHLLKRAHSSHDLPRSQIANTSLKSEAVVVICILLQGYSAAGTGPLPNHPQTRVNIRMKHVTDILTNKRMRSASYQAAFFRVGIVEVLFKAEQYRVEWDKAVDFQINTSKRLVVSDLLLSREALMSLIPPFVSDDDSTGVLEFLEALGQLHELLEASSSYNSLTRRLATPTYCILICIAANPQTHSEAQLSLCERLLSSSAFPKFDDYLISALGSALMYLWPSEFRQWNQIDPAASVASHRFKTFAQWRNSEDPVKARLRHFAATQTWLLLCLVGDATTTQQTDLRAVVGEYMYSDIRNERLTVHEAKKVLEEEVIRSYNNGHQMGVYSARVIECILEARKTPSDDELARRIQRELEHVPDYIRNLSSFLDSTEVTRLKSQLTNNQPGATPAPTTPQTTPTESDPGAPNASESINPPPGTDLRSPSTSSFAQAVKTPLPPSTGHSLSSLHLDPGSTPENRNVSHVAIPISPSPSPTGGV